MPGETKLSEKPPTPPCIIPEVRRAPQPITQSPPQRADSFETASVANEGSLEISRSLSLPEIRRNRQEDTPKTRQLTQAVLDALQRHDREIAVMSFERGYLASSRPVTVRVWQRIESFCRWVIQFARSALGFRTEQTECAVNRSTRIHMPTFPMPNVEKLRFKIQMRASAESAVSRGKEISEPQYLWGGRGISHEFVWSGIQLYSSTPPNFSQQDRNDIEILRLEDSFSSAFDFIDYHLNYKAASCPHDVAAGSLNRRLASSSDNCVFIDLVRHPSEGGTILELPWEKSPHELLLNETRERTKQETEVLLLKDLLANVSIPSSFQMTSRGRLENQSEYFGTVAEKRTWNSRAEVNFNKLYHTPKEVWFTRGNHGA